MYAQIGLCVVVFAFACFTDVHTGEANKISIAQEKGKCFIS